MAPVSYYYLLSLILTVGSMLWLVNILYIKLKGKTLFGKISAEGTVEHDRLLTLASTKRILVTAVASTTLLANQAISVYVVLNQVHPDKYILLISMPIVVAVVYILGVMKLRKDFKAFHPENKDREKNIDKRIPRDDSWLS